MTTTELDKVAAELDEAVLRAVIDARRGQPPDCLPNRYQVCGRVPDRFGHLAHAALDRLAAEGKVERVEREWVDGSAAEPGFRLPAGDGGVA